MSNVTDGRPTAAAIVPCLDEEDAIGLLVADVLAVAADPALPVNIIEIIVVDNGSTDRTAEVATAAGGRVVPEPRRGYGRACLTGVEAAEDAEIIILMDGDRSDRPDDLPLLLWPLLQGEADLVIGSRILGGYERGSLLPQQIVGNKVATLLLRLLYGVHMTDIGPLRVIRRSTLLGLGMREMTYGWSIEMIAQAVRAGLIVHEVPVRYRARAGGVSKVSGNTKASIKAGFRIIGAIIRTRR